jgi:hypothetical protein
METIIESKPRVRIDEIGLYLKTIELDYCPKDNEERASLITENFPVLCLKEDVDQYEERVTKNFIEENWELDARRHNFIQSLGIGNPYF